MGIRYRTGHYVEPVPAEALVEDFRQRLRNANLDPKTGRRCRSRPASTKVQHRPAPKLRRLLTRGAIASAVLAVAAGCATLDPEVAKAWKIEPVLNVTHTLQSSQAYYTMGRYHDGSQAWGKSVEAYRKAIAADAQNIEAYNALGVALARGGKLEDAETTLRQAVALDPSRPHVRSNLGYVLLLAGKPGAALSELEAAVRQDNGNMTAMANLRDARERLRLAAAPAGADSPAAATATEAGSATTTNAAAATVAKPEREDAGSERAGARAASAPGTVVSVPMPITAASVPAPVAGTIAVPAPLQTAAAPPMQVLVASTTSPFETVEEAPTVKPMDQLPSASADIPTDEAVNRPMVRQSVARRAELPSALRAAEDLTVRLEVSNGNGVTGMAARVGKWLGEQGIKTAALTNQRPYTQETTTVQYRAGQERAALRVARMLPAQAEPAAAPTPGLRGDVRVVLGRDWVKVGACMDVKTCRPEATAVAAAQPER